MEKKKFKRVPYGVINGAVQRFFVACGDDAGHIAGRMNIDPQYISDVVEFAKKRATNKENTEPTTVREPMSGQCQVKAGAKLLELVTIVEVPSISSFIARDKFREGKTTDGVKIAWLGQNFKDNFISKMETDVAPATLRIQKLKKASLDQPIRDEIGSDKEETSLAHIWELLKKQGAGQKGDLLVNGYANIFYIHDAEGNLWAVSAYWYSDRGGWRVEAYSVTDPSKWRVDDQVISR